MKPQTVMCPIGEGAPVFSPIIVAEISKHWTKPGDEREGMLSARFEFVVRHNNERGYRLVDWKMTTLLIPPNMTGKDAPGGIVETIVAVFEKA